jgi:hypothetical protein
VRPSVDGHMRVGDVLAFTTHSRSHTMAILWPYVYCRMSAVGYIVFVKYTSEAPGFRLPNLCGGGGGDAFSASAVDCASAHK